MECPVVFEEVRSQIFFLENRLERFFQFGGLIKPLPVTFTIDGFEKLIKLLHQQFVGKLIGWLPEIIQFYTLYMLHNICGLPGCATVVKCVHIYCSTPGEATTITCLISIQCTHTIYQNNRNIKLQLRFCRKLFLMNWRPG